MQYRSIIKVNITKHKHQAHKCRRQVYIFGKVKAKVDYEQ